MKDKILEIIVGAFKRKLIVSDMVEMNKIAGGINEVIKAHYMPVIEKQEEYISYLMKLIRMNNIVWDISIGPRGNYESEIADLKDKLKDK